jgi:hypothetical protein
MAASYAREGNIMKRIIIAASLLIISLAFFNPASGNTFEDDFGDGDFDGWEIHSFRGDESEWSVRNRKLISRCPSQWSSLLSIGETEWRNYSIEFDAKMMEIIDGSFHSIGLGLRVQDKYNMVWCGIGKGGARDAWIQVWNGGVSQISWNRDFIFTKKQWYHLKGVAIGKDFEFYIDNELVAALSNSRFPTGHLHLHASGCVAYFDNVVITRHNVPDNTTYAVSSPGKSTTSWGQVRIR